MGESERGTLSGLIRAAAGTADMEARGSVWGRPTGGPGTKPKYWRDAWKAHEDSKRLERGGRGSPELYLGYILGTLVLSLPVCPTFH